MNLTKELFVIPNKGRYILYAPLNGYVAEVNSATIGLLKKIQEGNYHNESSDIVIDFKENGILLEEKEKVFFEKEASTFSPVSVTLFPTSDCNLRCIYCYGSAGDEKKYMTYDIAKTAIDYVFENAKKTKAKRVNIGFHGGGEPLYNWKLVKSSIDYGKEKAKREDLEASFSSATNGVVNTKCLEWLVLENDVYLSISLDGPKDVQDKQRPLSNGKGSFDDVIKTIDYLEKNKKKYGVRATITSNNINRMQEMIDLFTNITSLKKFHFEPVYNCGRCKTTNTSEVDPKNFLSKMIEVMEYASKKGVQVYYSGGRADSIFNHFCGAAGRNFCVTPRGDITSCYEVSTEEDYRSKVFFYGFINEGKVHILEDKRKNLICRRVDNLEHCSDCFAKFNCAGDCLAKVLSSSGNMFDTSKNNRCLINRGILLNNLILSLNQGKLNEEK